MAELLKLKGSNAHHCHLSRKLVACWEETEQGIAIEKMAF
jgi:hypothetical protein